MCQVSSAMCYWLGLLLAVVALGQAAKGPCYNFTGDSYLEFRPSNLNISHNIHYKLKFMTTEPSGILLYSEGPHDYEALFVYEGQLIYLLANPSPSGVEGTSGGVYVTDMSVNDGFWYTVELWRNWETRRGRRHFELRTGMSVSDGAGNPLESRLDNLNHRHVFLLPTIFVGGVGPSVIHTQSSSVPPFKGLIKDIQEERNALDFKMYSLNAHAKVRNCS